MRNTKLRVIIIKILCRVGDEHNQYKKIWLALTHKININLIQKANRKL